MYCLTVLLVWDAISYWVILCFGSATEHKVLIFSKGTTFLYKFKVVSLLLLYLLDTLIHHKTALIIQV